jgi:hypothetical protein
MSENLIDSTGETTTPPTTITTDATVAPASETTTPPTTVNSGETTTPPTTVTTEEAPAQEGDPDNLETTTPPHPAAPEPVRPDLSGYEKAEDKPEDQELPGATAPVKQMQQTPDVYPADGTHSFGVALQMLQAGEKIKRVHWDDRHLVLNTTDQVNDFIQDVRGNETAVNGYSCNQHDILAHDWVVID